MSDSVSPIYADRLREALDVLLRRLEPHLAGGSVEIQSEAYWSVPTSALTDVYAEPPQLTIGAVSDAWRHVEAMIVDESRAVGYGLVWLADVLRVIGTENP